MLYKNFYLATPYGGVEMTPLKGALINYLIFKSLMRGVKHPSHKALKDLRLY